MFTTSVALCFAAVFALASAGGKPLDFMEKNPAGLFQGDMKDFDATKQAAMTEQESRFTQTKSQGGGQGIMVINPKYHWPNGKVFYELDATIKAHSTMPNIITTALAEISSKTCLTFAERTSETDYIYIKGNVNGCWSQVGRVGGRQEMSLNVDGCDHPVVVQHEMMHALGIMHEQSRTDRDDYIDINTANIIPGLEDNFDKVNPSVFSHYSTAYDYLSIMHYYSYAFSKDSNSPTITKKGLTGDAALIPYNFDLTAGDVARMKMMYCDDATTTAGPVTTTAGVTTTGDEVTTTEDEGTTTDDEGTTKGGRKDICDCEELESCQAEQEQNVHNCVMQCAGKGLFGDGVDLQALNQCGLQDIFLSTVSGLRECVADQLPQSCSSEGEEPEKVRKGTHYGRARLPADLKGMIKATQKKLRGLGKFKKCVKQCLSEDGEKPFAPCHKRLQCRLQKTAEKSELTEAVHNCAMEFDVENTLNEACQCAVDAGVPLKKGQSC